VVRLAFTRLHFVPESSGGPAGAGAPTGPEGR
jgi:hypothetical protein